MKKEVIIEFLKKVELFKDLDTGERRLLTENIKVETFKPDQFLFKVNAPRKYLFISYDGEVELFKKTSLGEEKRLAFFGKYDFLGEGALLEDYPHSASARAVIKSSVLIISTDKLPDLFKNQPEMSGKILSGVSKVISRRMRQTSTRVANAAAQYISGRTRSEHDLLGKRHVPHEYYYGIQTLRGLENFNISGVPLSQYQK